MNKGYQGLVLAASLFAIGCETKEDAEACEQYATYVCDCSDAAVAAQCDEAEAYAEDAKGDADAQDQCTDLLETLEAAGTCDARAVVATLIPTPMLTPTPTPMPTPMTRRRCRC